MTAKAASTKKTNTTKPKAASAKPKAAATSKAASAKTTRKPASKPLTTQQPKQGDAGKAKSALRTWNLRLGILLLALAVAVVAFGGSVSEQLTMHFTAKDTLASDATGREVLAGASRHLWDVNVSWLVAKVLVIFGAVFVLSATLLRKQYEAWLDRGVNGWRWLAFGLGGGAVVTTVAMLSGITDVTTLGLTFGSVALAGLLANAVEFIGDGRKLRRLLAAGALVAVFLPWLIFVRNVAGVVLYDGRLSVYMYFLYTSVTLLIVAVAAATYMRVKQRGRWEDTFYTERMFMMLAFLSAVVPALQIFAGALQ